MSIASVCGDSVLWKPSSQTPLTAIACTKIAEDVCRANGVDPAIFSLVVGKGSTVELFLPRHHATNEQRDEDGKRRIGER